MPCGPDDKDRWVISVHNVAPLVLAQLVDKAKLKYMYLVTDLTGRSGKPYRTLVVCFPGAEGAEEDEVIVLDTLLPPEAAINRLVGQEAYPDSAPTTQHENAADIVAQ